MALPPPSRPDAWRRVWRIATGNTPLAACLLALALYLLLLAWIPQFASGPAPADRWRAQTRFGPWTETMYRLGLFTLARSPIVPALLSLLAFLLLLRGADLAEALIIREPAGRRRWEMVFPLLACLGTLTLLSGLLVGSRWGWREEGLIGPETPVSAACPGRLRFYTVGSGPRLTIQATDAPGHPLDLQPTAREAARPELVLYLTPAAPEASFAIPESGLVVRLEAQGALSARSPIRVEVFRAPGGERVGETVSGEDALSWEVEGVRLEVLRSPYPLVAAACDPGLWLKWAGLVVGTVGMVGWWAMEGRRKALRPVLIALTVAVSGLTGYSLAAHGTLGAVPFQLEAAALWLVGLAIGLLRPERLSASG